MIGGWISAQRLPDTDIPAVPPTGLLDDHGVLGENSELQRRLVRLFQELETKYAYRVIVVLERSFIGTKARDYAAQLQKEWLPNGGGLVLVYESDTGEIGFGRGLESTDGMLEGDMEIPSFRLIDIAAEALEAAKGIEASEVFLDAFITTLCSELNEYFEMKNAPPEDGRSLRLALVTIGALSLLALCGVGLGWLIGKSDGEKSATKVFPQLDVSERLGAPYGGSGGVTRSFGRFGN